ncbi:beta-propeller domain-containing protein [Candidatus Peregrinibacteria bacterium]|nr:beta-propeller domain-containing protein [Candidatus Peregrinibacteria bacterium]
MNIFKRASLSVIIFGLLGLPILATASQTLPYNPDTGMQYGRYFKDVPDNHPFAETINNLKMKGLVKGYPDQTFAPDSTISRAEFITMVMASISKNPQGANCFKDVKNEWYARFICAAKAKKLVRGYADGTFKPGSNINFAEASAILVQANKLKPKKLAAGELWYKPAVKKLEAKAAIPMTVDYPDKKLSRAEVAEMIWRLKNKVTNKSTKTFESLTAPFPVLASCDELKEKISIYQYKNSSRRYGILEESIMPLSAAPSMGLQKSEAVSSDDYSATNVQVEGVDEADIIKNDGEFIYMMSGNKVRIIKAFPPEEMQEVSKLEFSDKNFNPGDIYVSGNKLVVIGSTYLESPTPNTEPSAHVPVYYNRSKTEVFIVDIADKTAPKEERFLYFDGNQLSSRRIGNRLYLVLHHSPSYYGIQPLADEPSIQAILPHMYDSQDKEYAEPIAPCSAIHFLPKYDAPDFLAVVSVDIENADVPLGKEVIMGSGGTVYASPESLYIAATRYEYPEIEKFNVWMPPAQNESTMIYRFSLENGDAKYVGQGQVKGHLLNQFSMDESGDAFRLATTTGQVWNTKDPSKNHLFILNRNNLATVLGKIEDIAPGEKIYSVRFLGKRAYMVTFKKVDPFFVIDVEDPANPRILGALKIPGFSDYLHPFDENHIIGFGKEAVDPQNVGNEWPGRDFDFAWYQGMKIALFDVTDVSAPKMLFKEIIGDRGTDSEVLSNHKALLYDKARNLFAFPITVHEIKPEIKAKSGGYTGSTYGDPVFQGAYIYTLDLENGFQLKGQVTHYDNGLPKRCYPNYDESGEQSEQCYFNPQPANTVNRIIYIGDYLYTISLGKVKAVKREDISEVKKLVIPTDDVSIPGFLEDLLQ